MTAPSLTVIREAETCRPRVMSATSLPGRRMRVAERRRSAKMWPSRRGAPTASTIALVPPAFPPGHCADARHLPCTWWLSTVRGGLYVNGLYVRQFGSMTEPLLRELEPLAVRRHAGRAAARGRQRNRDPAAHLLLGPGLAGAGATGSRRQVAPHVAAARVLAERAGAHPRGEHRHHRPVPAGCVAGPALARDVLLVRLRVAAVDGHQPGLLRADPAAAGPDLGTLHGGGPGAARRAHVHVHAALHATASAGRWWKPAPGPTS